MAALTVKGQGLKYLLIAIVQKNKLDSYKFFLVALYLFACSKEYYASRFNKNKNLIDMKNIGFEKLIILILILAVAAYYSFTIYQKRKVRKKKE